jgi:hypothetical protein
MNRYEGLFGWSLRLLDPCFLIGDLYIWRIHACKRVYRVLTFAIIGFMLVNVFIDFRGHWIHAFKRVYRVLTFTIIGFMLVDG